MAIHGRGVGSICHAIEGGVPTARANLTVVLERPGKGGASAHNVKVGNARVHLWTRVRRRELPLAVFFS